MTRFVVIGGGPCGLAFATACVLAGHTVQMVERESSLGGCHRVLRRDGAWTEHSPRVYSSSYVNFGFMLKEMGLDFYDLFVPYKFDIARIGSAHLSVYEKLVLAKEFAMFVAGLSTNVTMDELTRKFSPASREYLDRLCRLTDGGGLDRYGSEEFMQLANQEFFNSLYQPRLPNDVGLFKRWSEFLVARGASFRTDEEVVSIESESGKISGVVTKSGGRVQGDVYVFCIPPQALDRLFSDIHDFAEATEYADYVSVSFHWRAKLPLMKVWGFPAGAWGVAFIVQSDYTNSIEEGYETVISCAVTLTDRPGRSGKTANACSSSEIIEETLLQLRESYPDLPYPDLSLVNPNIYYREDEKKWESRDSAYFKNALLKNPYLSSRTPYANGFNCGCHNGESPYGFTSLEGAVSNAVALANDVVPGFRRPVRNTLEVKTVVRVLVVVVAVLTVARVKRKTAVKR